jgi:hypothetical protein
MKRFGYFLPIWVAIAGMWSTPGLALDASFSSVSRSAPGGNPPFCLDADRASSHGRLVSALISDSISVVSGGTFFRQSLIVTAAPYTEAHLEGPRCRFFDAQIISQNGADGTIETDDYMGIVFRARETAGGPLYEYEFAISGVTNTRTINTRTLVDTTPPVLTPPADQSRTADAGGTTATLDVTSLGSVTDNSGTAPAIVYRANGTVLTGPFAFPLGVTTVTMDATDDAGNAAAQASFTVTVTDGETPVITPPADQTLAADAGGTTATLDVTSLGSVTDNSGSAPAIVYRANGTVLTGPFAFPLGVTTVTMDATDDEGNAAAQASFTVTVEDRTAPTVALFTTATRVSAGDRVLINIAFSESVTGLAGSEFVLSNATLVSLTGSGAAWVATLSATGSGDVAIAVPADAAEDAAGNGNIGSETLRIRDITVEETQTQIAQFMQSRANLLLQSQPELAHFLSRTGEGRFDAQVTRGHGVFNFASDPGASVWVNLHGSWTNERTRDLAYLFGAIGSHATLNNNLLVGGMIQFDHLDQSEGAESIEGTGWLAGPYFVARLPEQNVYVDGRLLYGQTSNRISPFGTYTDTFDTERLLASLKVSGVLDYGQTDIIPSLKASYTRDKQSAYKDTPGNTIPEQAVELGQIEAGLAFATPMPLYNSAGEMTLTGGITAIGSFVNGAGHAASIIPEYEGGRARIDLGLLHSMANGGVFSIQSYYDGIGTSGFESYGLSLSFEMQF